MPIGNFISLRWSRRDIAHDGLETVSHSEYHIFLILIKFELLTQYHFFIILIITMRTKGQQPKVAKLELLAFVSFRGGLAEGLNAADCKSVSGGPPIARGFKSLTRRQTLTSPTRSANCGQGLSLGLAPEAGLLRSTAIVRPFPKKRKVHIDVSQL